MDLGPQPVFTSWGEQKVSSRVKNSGASDVDMHMFGQPLRPAKYEGGTRVHR